MSAHDNIGYVASKRGIIGIITNKKGDVYFGMTLSGSSWQAIDPIFLAPSVFDYIRIRLGADDPYNAKDKTFDLIREIEDGTPIKLRKRTSSGAENERPL